jgi:hypothetical protein
MTTEQELSAVMRSVVKYLRDDPVLNQPIVRLGLLIHAIQAISHLLPSAA